MENSNIYSTNIQSIIQAHYIDPQSKLDKYSELLDTNKSIILKNRLKNKNNHTVLALMLKDDILYLKIKSFDLDTAHVVRKYILRYRFKAKGLILDLRNNPGGLLMKAIEIGDYFVDDSIVLKAVGRDEKDLTIYKTYTYNTLTTVPIVVLVNKYTISAAEILAGILQDKKRAILIGERTFGKTSIQDLIPVDNDKILKLTTERYYFSSGEDITGKGLLPDIDIKNRKIIKYRNITLSQKLKIMDIKSKNRDYALLVSKALL